MRESKTIREELKQARDQLQQQNQEIGDKHEEWKRAKEEMGKRMGEVESQLDGMDREKRRNKVVMMELEIGTGEQKQIIEKVGGIRKYRRKNKCSEKQEELNTERKIQIKIKEEATKEINFEWNEEEGRLKKVENF
ncbi:hypothetical protein Zmor_016116 [Zophobas morio]|uniref:Uncharacterized protein n=1 Tax=Zophobas morio TaxID=2755281 RepID=A0AA38INC5_9CUCU|nr:hypothetical protein Zmor_016116 [Zophobas morio]